MIMACREEAFRLAVSWEVEESFRENKPTANKLTAKKLIASLDTRMVPPEELGSLKKIGSGCPIRSSAGRLPFWERKCVEEMVMLGITTRIFHRY
jgi:hypothetical protein